MPSPNQQHALNQAPQVDFQSPNVVPGTSGQSSQFYWAVGLAVLAAVGLIFFMTEPDLPQSGPQPQAFPPAQDNPSTADLLNNQTAIDSPHIWAIGAGVSFIGFLLLLTAGLRSADKNNQRRNNL